MSKKIAVFGATGGTGLLFCEKALEKGHSLNIYARNPSKLPWELTSKANVKVLKGELDDDKSISEIISGQDLVVSFLGPTTLLSKVPATVYTDAYKKIFAAMRQHGIKQIHAVGIPYMHDEQDPGGLKPAVARMFMKTVASGVYAAFQAIGELFDENKDFDWTIVRVARLLDKKLPVRVGLVGDAAWSGTTSRDGAAEWMVELVDKEGEYIRQRPTLSS